uniref:Origin recognition complex subunit 1 n=1 Tax=Rhabditophanes sp. KR3021 TaxID=114890 RepID=A0AC35TQY9_9BILA
MLYVTPLVIKKIGNTHFCEKVQRKKVAIDDSPEVNIFENDDTLSSDRPMDISSDEVMDADPTNSPLFTPSPPKSLKKQAKSPAIKIKKAKKSESHSTKSSAMIKAVKNVEKSELKDLVGALNKLHTSETPDKLVCREIEVAAIKSFINLAISNEGESSAMYISGVPGTGKTASVLQVLKSLSKDKKKTFDFCYVNGMELPQQNKVFSEIYKELCNNVTIAPTKARLALNEMFQRKDASRKPVIILVDELDLLITKRHDIMYDIFNWTTCIDARVSVISIANALDLPERILSQRVTSRIGTNRISFQPYDHHQISKIINYRLKGFHCIENKAIDLASRKIAALNGDLRKAIGIIRKAVELALARELKEVNTKLVLEAIKDTASNVYAEYFKDLSYVENLIMESVVQVQLSKGLEEISISDIYNQYLLIARQKDDQIVSFSTIFERICFLDNCKLLSFVDISNSSIMSGKITLGLTLSETKFNMKLASDFYEGLKL